METMEQNANDLVEDNAVMKQLMKLLEQQNMGDQKKDFMEFFQYVAGMQEQLGTMLDELQGVRQELSELRESQPKMVTESLMDRVAHLQEKIINLSERLSAVKDHLMETAAQAVRAFKEKGREGMCKALQKGISGVKKMLTDYRENLEGVMADYQKTADRIDSIGNELKQIGNSVANVGRLLTGKDAKEVSSEKPGVGLTRVINMPFKKNVENLRKEIAAVDKALGKLDRLSDSLNGGREAEKGGRSSIKDKLSQMKARADQHKKAPEPEKARAKGKEECL